MPILQNMRPLIFALSLLLASALCGCHSTKHVTSESTEVSNVVASEVKTSTNNEDILSVLKETTDIELSGIVIEYAEIDSTAHNSRTAPKKITVEKAYAHKALDASGHKVTSAMECDSVNVSASHSLAESAAVEVDNDMCSGQSFLAWLPLIALSLAIISLMIKK